MASEAQTSTRPPRGADTPAWAEQLVRFMDDGLRVPGTDIRLGFDALAGLLLPGVGDAVGAVSSLSLFWLALRLNVPRVVLVRMALNVGLDALVGTVPLLGDLFDLTWKANRRNLRLIQDAGTPPDAPRPRRVGDWLIIGALLLAVIGALCLPLVLLVLALRALFSQG
ncbi:MAG TPA: DUF4112 domain-containing protein [Polyangiales bacterium]